MATTRKYRVFKADGTERIVIATSQAQAISYVSRREWGAEPLSVDHAIRLAHKGVEVEHAVEAESAPAQSCLAVDGPVYTEDATDKAVRAFTGE